MCLLEVVSWIYWVWCAKFYVSKQRAIVRLTVFIRDMVKKTRNRWNRWNGSHTADLFRDYFDSGGTSFQGQYCNDASRVETLSPLWTNIAPVHSKRHADDDPRGRSKDGEERSLVSVHLVFLSMVLIKVWNKRKPSVPTKSSFLTWNMNPRLRKQTCGDKRGKQEQKQSRNTVFA